MTGLSFFRRGHGLTVGEIAAMVGAEISHDTKYQARIDGIAPLDTAGPSDLSFIESSKFSAHLTQTRAGACFATDIFAKKAPDRLVVIKTARPYAAFITVAQALFPQALRPSSLFEADGLSSDAFIHPTARVENGVTIEAGAVIGPRAEIGANSLIGPTAVIGPDVRIGRDCVVAAGAVISNALIGDRVIVHPGCRIGQDGFGYNPGPKGLRKVPQIGRVIIQDDVEIGANSTIDRGGMRDTVIGEGTKIDNLVQIGHNCMIGRHCVIVSQTGISGSVTVGDGSMFGGQAGIADNLTIGEGSQIAAKTGVMSDLPPGGKWAGAPAMPIREFMRAEAMKQRALKQAMAGVKKGSDNE